MKEKKHTNDESSIMQVTGPNVMDRPLTKVDYKCPVEKKNTEFGIACNDKEV
jgi:hypothetical protein